MSGYLYNKLHTCPKCGNSTYIYDLKTGNCVNCGIDPQQMPDTKDYLEFEVNMVQKMSEKRFMIEIPKSLNYKLEELGRKQHWIVKAYPTSSVRFKKVRIDNE